MATKKTVRRKAIIARKGARRSRANEKRGAPATVLSSGDVRRLNRDYKKSGGQIAFPKDTNAAYRHSVRKSMAAGEGARKAHDKGGLAMVQAYSGANDRRNGDRRTQATRRGR